MRSSVELTVAPRSDATPNNRLVPDARLDRIRRTACTNRRIPGKAQWELRSSEVDSNAAHENSKAGQGPSVPGEYGYNDA
jgi:hypothetical protein